MVDTFTYNPNHTEQVRKILANATPEERAEYLRLSKVSLGWFALGFVVGLAPMLYLMITAGVDAFTPLNVVFMFVGFGIGAAIVLWHIRMTRRAVRRLLVSFAWAKEQGITSETLQLDQWG